MPVRGLWVPPNTDAMLDLRAQVDAERQAYVEARLGHVQHINAELKRIDPYLELVRVREDAPDDDPAIRPGFWHVMRHNPGAPDSWMPVTGANGEFAEPTSRIFEKLAEGDMWRDEHSQRARKRQADRIAAEEREKEARRQRHGEELRERYLAATRTQVSMNRDTPWTQNASPASRRDAASRKKKD